MNVNALEFRGVAKSFGEKAVLKGVDLAVKQGEVMFIVGTSGVGKSVTIKHVIGLLRADAGEIHVFGERVDQLSEAELYPVRMQCAMVFQHATLFDSMTLAQNVALPLVKHRRPNVEGRARELLDEVGLGAHVDEFPAQMGDGMRKRAAIARALTLEPKIVLYDEPTTGLDPVTAMTINRLIVDLNTRLSTTSVVVTHDIASALYVADRIAFLEEGRFAFVGTPGEARSSDVAALRAFLAAEEAGA